MVEVMTDKATVTIGAPKTGKVAERRYKVGVTVPVGDVLVVLEVGGDGAPAAAPAPAAAKPAPAAAPAKLSKPGAPRTKPTIRRTPPVIAIAPQVDDSSVSRSGGEIDALKHPELFAEAYASAGQADHDLR